MNLTCPSCDTTFRVDAARLGPKGRSVRCGACGKSWFQEPEARQAPVGADAAIAEPEAAVQATPAALAEASAATEAEPAPAAAPPPAPPVETPAPQAAGEAPEEAPPEETPPEETTPEAPAEDSGTDAPAANEASAAPPAERRERPRRAGARKSARTARAGAGGSALVTLGWILFLAVVAALAGGFYFAQEQIVARVPAMARLYDLVGLGAAPSVDLGLELREVKSVRRLVDGARVVVIEGLVANVADAEREVPTLRARLLGTGGESLDQWTFEAENKHLPPGGTTRFETTAQNPPPEGQLSIEFVAPD